MAQQLQEQTFVVELDRTERYDIIARLENLGKARTKNETELLEKLQRAKPKS